MQWRPKKSTPIRFAFPLGFAALIASVVALAVTPARAMTIEIVPSAASVEVGDSFSIDLVVSGLGASSAPSIGAYDLIVGYSDAVLAATSVSFGDPGLGNQLNLAGFGTFTDIATGTSSGHQAVFELSFDSAGDLDSLQASSFVLASIQFDAITAGSSGLDWEFFNLSDASANRLDANFIAASIRVDEPGSAVNPIPEPTAAVVFAVGMTVVGARVRTRRA